MLFQLPEELKQLRQKTREFLDKEIAPIAYERDCQGPLSREEIRDFVQKLKPLGYVVGHVPEEWGGTNLSYLTKYVLGEEIGRVWVALGTTLDTHGIIAGLIARSTLPDELKNRLIPPALEGDSLMCDMMSEPESGSDSRNLKTTAILDGDAYVVNGTKVWSTNAFLADAATVSAVSDPKLFAETHRQGVVRLLVEKKASHWKARDIPFIGLRAGNTGYIEFENTRVPKENVVQSKGYEDTLITRGAARVSVAAKAVGLMQAALEDATNYAKKRIQFGKPIGGFQLIQSKIADMLCDLEASRFMVYRAAELMDSGTRCDVEQNMAKTYATEAAKRVTDQAIQIHGALGLTTNEGYRTERYYRDARLTTVGEGTTEIVKLVIGRSILGLQAFS